MPVLLRETMRLRAIAFAVIAAMHAIMSLRRMVSISSSVNRRQGLLHLLARVAVFLVMATRFRNRA